MERIILKKEKKEILNYLLENPYLQLECPNGKEILEKAIIDLDKTDDIEMEIEMEIEELEIKKYLLRKIKKREEILEDRKYIIKDVFSSVSLYTKDYHVTVIQFVSAMLKPWWEHKEFHSSYVYLRKRSSGNCYSYYSGESYARDAKEGDLIYLDLPHDWYYEWFSEDQRTVVENSVNPIEKLAEILLQRLGVQTIEDYFTKVVRFAEPEYTPERVIFSCCKGTAPVSVPLYWLNGFNPDISFGYDPEEKTAYIRFPNGKAYYVVPIYKGRRTDVSVGRVTFPDSVKWGPVCRPWEYLGVGTLFGVSSSDEPLDNKFNYDYNDISWFKMSSEERLAKSMIIFEENMEKYKIIINVDNVLRNYNLLKALISKGIKENWDKIKNVLRDLHETLKPFWEVWNYNLSRDDPYDLYFRISDALWSIAYKNKF